MILPPFQALTPKSGAGDGWGPRSIRGWPSPHASAVALLVFVALIGCASGGQDGASPGRGADTHPSAVRLDPDAASSTPVGHGASAGARAASPSVQRALPSQEEVDAVTRLIASLDPESRHEAYRALLDQGVPGYDEVFLLGLNEDDYAALEVVVSYFQAHHPRQAVEPLLDLLIYLQGDRAMRDRIVVALEGFGQPVIAPVVARLERQPEAQLAGGARKGLEQVLVGAVDRSGTAVLNHFIATAEPEWLLAYGVMGAERIDTPDADVETFRVLAQRLAASQDARAVEGLLRLAARLARRPDLPDTVRLVVPAAMDRLQGRSKRWALYALAMLADDRVSRRCRRLARKRAIDRFWVYQVLAASGDRKAMEAVANALDDPNDDIRSEAAFLLSLDPVSAAVPGLRRWLADDRLPVERAAVVALQRLRDVGARPLLEARLTSVPLDMQAEILTALLPVADDRLAAAMEGWIDLTLVAPSVLGKVSLVSGPGRDALLAAAMIVAAGGGERGRAYLTRLAGRVGGDAGCLVALCSTLSRRLENGLAHTLETTVLGATRPPVFQSLAGRDPGPRFFRSGLSGPSAPRVAPRTGAESCRFPRRMRESLFLLCPTRADAGTREVLETILLHAPWYRDRVLAADALRALADPAAIPALKQALADPWFRDGPYPLYRYPVRRAAARALEAMGVRVVRHADRRFTIYSH